MILGETQSSLYLNETKRFVYTRDRYPVEVKGGQGLKRAKDVG